MSISRYFGLRSSQMTAAFLLSLTFCHFNTGCGSSNPSPVLSSALAEPEEELSGGDTTVFTTHNTAFSLPAANLSFEQEGDFKIGNSFFEQAWVSAPATTTARDGLGPTFNAVSCAACHTKDGRGAPPESPSDVPLALLFRLSVPGKNQVGGPVPEPNYGEQLQVRANLDIPNEGKVSVDYEEISGQYEDGTSYTLLKPIYTIYDLNFGELHPDTAVSPRIAPHMSGMGLLEAISEADLLALADPEDENGDGISGRANWVWDVTQQKTVLGRFGWKANQPSVRQQVAGAFNGDIGITSELFPEQNCPPSQSDCLTAAHGGEPELGDDILNLVEFYSQTLGVPARRNWEDPTVLRGKLLFQEAACTRCHVPQQQTASDYVPEVLAGQVIRPYTDLLLHDMGAGLADNREDFEAEGREWRTPPLWGIGLIETVNGHTRFLHDGRARNFSEAILWHGGEAEASKENFRKLPAEDREALIQFLKSL